MSLQQLDDVAGGLGIYFFHLCKYNEKSKLLFSPEKQAVRIGKRHCRFTVFNIPEVDQSSACRCDLPNEQRVFYDNVCGKIVYYSIDSGNIVHELNKSELQDLSSNPEESCDQIAIFEEKSIRPNGYYSQGKVIFVPEEIVKKDKDLPNRIAEMIDGKELALGDKPSVSVIA